MPADGQSGGLGPPDPELCSPRGPGWQPPPEERSWLQLSLAHLPLDCPLSSSQLLSVILGFCLLWALPTPQAAPVSSRLSLSEALAILLHQALVWSGCHPPLRFSLPTVPSFNLRVCLLAAPPPSETQGGDPHLRCFLLRSDLQRSQELQPPESRTPPGGTPRLTHTRSPSPSRPRQPSPQHLSLRLQQVPKHWGASGCGLGGGSRRFPGRPERRAPSPAV